MIVVTDHAAERYVKRHAPTLSLAEAKAVILGGFETAGRLKSKTITGTEQWQLDQPRRCVAVVKRDPDGTIAVVTVLPAQDHIGLAPELAEWLIERGERDRDVGRALAEVSISADSKGTGQLRASIEDLSKQLGSLVEAQAEVDRLRQVIRLMMTVVLDDEARRLIRGLTQAVDEVTR